MNEYAAHDGESRLAIAIITIEGAIYGLAGAFVIIGLVTMLTLLGSN